MAVRCPKSNRGVLQSTALGYVFIEMIRRFPVRLSIVTPGPRADALVEEVCSLLTAERLPSAPGEVCISVAGIGLRDAARRAERALAAQGFGWSAHVSLAEAMSFDPSRRAIVTPGGAPRQMRPPDRRLPAR